MSGYLVVKASVCAAVQWSCEGQIHGHSIFSGLEGGTQLLLPLQEKLMTHIRQTSARDRM
jgi:hypothetical protein